MRVLRDARLAGTQFATMGNSGSLCMGTSSLPKLQALKSWPWCYCQCCCSSRHMGNPCRLQRSAFCLSLCNPSCWSRLALADFPLPKVFADRFEQVLSIWSLFPWCQHWRLDGRFLPWGGGSWMYDFFLIMILLHFISSNLGSSFSVCWIFSCRICIKLWVSSRFWCAVLFQILPYIGERALSFVLGDQCSKHWWLEWGFLNLSVQDLCDWLRDSSSYYEISSWCMHQKRGSCTKR